MGSDSTLGQALCVLGRSSTRESGSAVEDVDAATADLPALDHTAFIDSEGGLTSMGLLTFRGS